MHELRGKLREGLAVELLYLPGFFRSAVHDSGSVESTIRAECAAVENLVPLSPRAYRCLFVYNLRLHLREWQERLKQSWSSFMASGLRSQISIAESMPCSPLTMTVRSWRVFSPDSILYVSYFLTGNVVFQRTLSAMAAGRLADGLEVAQPI